MRQKKLNSRFGRWLNLASGVPKTCRGIRDNRDVADLQNSSVPGADTSSSETFRLKCSSAGPTTPDLDSEHLYILLDGNRFVTINYTTRYIFWISLLNLNWNGPCARDVTPVISNAKIALDCLIHDVIVVNDDYPGPILTVVKHWHGIKQRLSNEVYGTAMVTQCPMTSGHYFMYDFMPTNQSVTFWCEMTSYYLNEVDDSQALAFNYASSIALTVLDRGIT
ncbi:uncharacterized protein EDB93DRAFT_1297264 [Suillus bovinus]|uniref:uncharacterized protein n=1 Tax=Suillus bovinus TaxID=48563 RepID=UPI001B8774A9|nr:uncharacterized protein EDB93DRAFT_1297264 [Suillus bovinus]KAG2140530.1 hypothetical protein EDB93DRAFT_1297264 [Suillus bovinus]